MQITYVPRCIILLGALGNAAVAAHVGETLDSRNNNNENGKKTNVVIVQSIDPTNHDVNEREREPIDDLSSLLIIARISHRGVLW